MTEASKEFLKQVMVEMSSPTFYHRAIQSRFTDTAQFYELPEEDREVVRDICQDVAETIAINATGGLEKISETYEIDVDFSIF